MLRIKRVSLRVVSLVHAWLQILAYPAKNPTDLYLQVVNFSGLLERVNQLQQTYQFHRVTTSVVEIRLVNCKPYHLQVTASLILTTLWLQLDEIDKLTCRFLTIE